MTRRISFLCMLLIFCMLLISCTAGVTADRTVPEIERTAERMYSIDLYRPEQHLSDATAVSYEMSEEEKMRRYGAPDSILNDPTEELLVYFLRSDFMQKELLAPELFSSLYGMYCYSPDYTIHAAYAELITREDLAAVLMRYAAELSPDNVCDKQEIEAFDLLLLQPEIRVALGLLAEDVIPAPYLLSTAPTDLVLGYVIYDVVKPAYLGVLCFSTGELAEQYLDKLSFTSYEAYQILLSRDDLGEALERYANALQNDPKALAWDDAIFELLLDKMIEDTLV